MGFEKVARVTTDHPPEVVRRYVEDLGDYPQWHGLVAKATSIDDADPPAWHVDLRARVGPLARSKRLRMERTRHEPSVDGGVSVRFERAETDGRDHSPWVLDAEICRADGAGTELVMTLHYGGSLFGPMLARLLDEEIARSRRRLLALLDPMA